MDTCFTCHGELTDLNWYPSYRKIGKHQCKSCAKVYKKQWEKDHKETVLAQRRVAAVKSYRATGGRAAKANALQVRMEVIKAYGGVCDCCGEATWQFLEIDHRNGEGNKHRRALGVNGGYQFYLWLRKNNYPKEGFRLLCSNCNLARARYGRCPHEEPTGGF